MVKKVVEFQRLQLFDELWAHPLGDLAQHYGVAVTDIRLAAQAMELPMPPAGHWTKAAHGKAGAKPALPNPDAPTSHRHSWYVSEEDEEIKRRFAPRMQSLQRIAAPMPPLATSLDECLPLVRLMSIRLKKAYQDARRWPAIGGNGIFEVSVALQNQPRALLTLDRAVKYCQAAGLKLVASEKSDKPARFVVEGQALTLRIFEPAKQVENELTSVERAKLKANPDAYLYRDKFVFRPTNTLRLEVRLASNRWTLFSVQDGSEEALAERLGDVPERMRAAAVRLQLRDEIWAEQRRHQEQLQVTQDEQKALKEAALKKLGQFEDMARRLERAARLRALAAALESSRTLSPERATAQLEWLRNAADWLDPTVRTHWAVMGDAEPIL